VLELNIRGQWLTQATSKEVNFVLCCELLTAKQQHYEAPLVLLGSSMVPMRCKALSLLRELERMGSLKRKLTNSTKRS
jgi:hypothetical protein